MIDFRDKLLRYDHQERPISKEAMVNFLVPIRHQLCIVPKLTESTKEYLIWDVYEILNFDIQQVIIIVPKLTESTKEYLVLIYLCMHIFSNSKNKLYL